MHWPISFSPKEKEKWNSAQKELGRDEHRGTIYLRNFLKFNVTEFEQKFGTF
jgi:hypothetical protein